MKINGELVRIREIAEVILVRSSGVNVSLKVSGYPIGISRDYLAVYARPLAPKKATGVVSVKGGAEAKPDYDDPAYAAKLDEWIFLEKFFMICKCLEVDTSVTFESNYNTLDGLRKIPGELREAGFSEGDIGAIFTAINKATTIEPKAIEEAAANFT